MTNADQDEDAAAIARSMQGVIDLKRQVAELTQRNIELENAVTVRDQQIAEAMKALEHERELRTEDANVARTEVTTARLMAEQAVAERAAFEQLMEGIDAQIDGFIHQRPTLMERRRRARGGNSGQQRRANGVEAVAAELTK